MSYMSLTTVITGTVLTLNKTLTYSERKTDGIAVKDVFAKVAPTSNDNVFRDSPIEYTIKARLTATERIEAYDLEDDAEIIDLQLNGVHVDYVWLEKVMVQHRITEDATSYWVMIFYLVHIDYEPYLSLCGEEWVEVDAANKITIAENCFKVDYVEVSLEYEGWLRRPMAFVGDYEIQFETQLYDHSGSDTARAYCLAVMDDTLPETATYLGAAVLKQTSGGTNLYLGIVQSAGPALDQQTQAINEDQTYYCTLKRTTGVLTLDIYTDSARTVLLATLTSPTTLHTAGTQLYAIACGVTEEDGWLSGFTQNILVVST